MKKRFLLVLSVLILAGVGVSLWMKEQPPTAVSPAAQEILHQAARRSSELMSARMDVEGSLESRGGAMPLSGRFAFRGSFADGGAVFQCDGSVDAGVTPGGDASQFFRVRSQGGVVLLRRSEFFFRIDTFASEPESALFDPRVMALLTGRWWLLPPAYGVRDAPSALPGGVVTPSPLVLNAQADVVRVVRDLGKVEIEGAPAHHFRVAIDTGKLLAYLEQSARERQEPFDGARVAEAIRQLEGTGDLWIDDQTRFVRRVQWDLMGLQMGPSTLEVSFSATFSDFNAVPPIPPPADAQPLSPATLFGLTPEQAAAEAPLTEEQQQRLRSLLDDAPLLPSP